MVLGGEVTGEKVGREMRDVPKAMVKIRELNALVLQIRLILFDLRS